MCKLLLDKGADVNLVSNGDLGFEMTALDNALNRDVRQVSLAPQHMHLVGRWLGSLAIWIFPVLDH